MNVPLGAQGNAEEKLNRISGEIINAAMKVHSALGPGLLESAYQACLLHELQKRNMKVSSQCEMPIVYDNVSLDVGYRLDLLVDNCVIVELKAVEKINPIHEAQLLSYLKISNLQLGLLINFNVLHLKEGLKRIVNNFGRTTLRSSASSAVIK